MSYLPFISVVIPVRNEEKYIDNCLNSIIKGDYPKEYFEIIVIDGMSDDATKDKIISWSAKHENILLLDNPKKIVTSALNLGINKARGEIVVRIDAHAEYAPDYISKCVEWLEKTGAANVGGAQRAVSRKGSFIADALAFVNNSRFGLGGARFRDPNYEGYVKSVWLGAFRKEVLSKVGGFTEVLYRSEDIELNYRIRKAGYKIFMTPEIKSYYYSRDTLFKMTKRCFLDGRGVIQTLFFNKEALSLRHFIPLIFVSSILISAAFSSFTGFGKIVLFISGGSYLIASFIFSIRIGINKGLKYIIISPIVFVAIHFSYGIGSLVGVMNVISNFIKKIIECDFYLQIAKDRFFKRCFDILASSFGLILTGWIIFLAYIAASIDTRKNGFFTQLRVGRYGNLFKVIKIRTMRDIPCVITTVTTEDDPRITPVGRFLRKTKIDELPQLINIFLGHMSFVGPRPDVPGFADKLSGDNRIILSVRPGITGPATLKYRNEEEKLARQVDPEKYNREVIFPDKVKLNREYVENYSFWKDMRYIWQTIFG